MKDKDFDHIARVEKAIAEKYGDDAVSNPRANWSEEKEKEYLQQMKALYQKTKHNDETCEKVDVNGIKVSKKLLNKASTRTCPVCETYSFSMKDDIYMNKYDCCFKCYIQYVDKREERWLEGWRPDK